MIDVGRDLERMRDYVAGRLSDDEQRAFEDRLVRDPSLVRELELSQRLRAGLERLRAQGRLDVTPPRRGARHWARTIALAAMLAGVALVIWMQPAVRSPPLLMSAIPAGSASSGRPAALAAQFTLIATRGPSTASVLELPRQGLIELRASRPASAPGGRYRVTLDRIGADGARVAAGELAGLEAGPDGLVRAYAEAVRLTPGDYELRVTADGDRPDMAERFPFSARRQAQ
jgi:hypothetical protein